MKVFYFFTFVRFNSFRSIYSLRFFPAICRLIWQLLLLSQTIFILLCPSTYTLPRLICELRCMLTGYFVSTYTPHRRIHWKIRYLVLVWLPSVGILFTLKPKLINWNHLWRNLGGTNMNREG